MKKLLLSLIALGFIFTSVYGATLSANACSCSDGDDKEDTSGSDKE